MATTGAANSFVLNITELQNTVTTATGLTPYDTLNAKIGQIEQFVIVGENRIAVDTISAYTSGGTIQVVDPINIGATGGLTIANQAVNAGTSAGPTGPTGPVEPYSTVTSSYWLGTAPATTQDAIERMASLLNALNGGNPIP